MSTLLDLDFYLRHPIVRRTFPPLKQELDDIARTCPMPNIKRQINMRYILKPTTLKTFRHIFGYFSELEENYNPKTILIYRKTKAGRWQLVQKRWKSDGTNSIDYAKIANKLAYNEATESNCSYDVAYKITTAKGKDGNTMGKQIYCTKYSKFLHHLCDERVEGIVLDKKRFIPSGSIMNVIRKLCKEHNGIKLWKQASDCAIDNHLIWGHLVMNDGFSVSIAFVGISHNN